MAFPTSSRHLSSLLRTASSASRCGFGATTRTAAAQPQSIALLSTSSSSRNVSAATADADSSERPAPPPPASSSLRTSRWSRSGESSRSNPSASGATPRYNPARNPPMDPKKTVDAMQAWFRQRFPALALPDDVVLQAVTHESFDHGLGGRAAGHNRRLAFLGRRAMQMFLAVFLEAHLSAALLAASQRHAAAAAAAASTAAGSTSTPPPPAVAPAVQKLMASVADIEAALLVQRLGDDVGRHLALEEVMRWRPAVADGQAGPKQTGLFKIRGVAVEALLGAVYHQHGAETARAFFHVHVLPHLDTLPEQAHAELQSSIDQEAHEGQRLLDARAREQAGA